MRYISLGTLEKYIANFINIEVSLLEEAKCADDGMVKRKDEVMRKMKWSFSCILCFVILSLSHVSVHATGIKAILNNQKTELKSEDEVIVTLKLDNYEEVNKGVNAYKATLEYDKREEVRNQRKYCR